MPRSLVLILFLALVLLGGCGPSHRLAEYDFAGRSVAVMAAIPPSPRVLSGPWGEAVVDPRDPIGSAMRVGTAAHKWEEARRAQARLDSAAQRVDVAEIVARRALAGSAEILGYGPVNDPRAADFVLDIRLYDYGLVADSYEGATFFAMEADVVLRDRAGQTVWKRKMREREVLVGSIFGLPAAAGNVVTARALARLSTEEMVRGLERLAVFAADRVTERLRHDFAESRDES